MGSVIIIISAVITIMIIRYPSTVRPEGVGNRTSIIPTAIVIRNHFFWVTQKRKFVSDDLEKPSIKTSNLGNKILQDEMKDQN